MRGLNTPGAVQYAEQRMKENILLSLDRCAGNCVSDMLALVRRTLLPNTDVCQAGSRLCGSMSTLWISRARPRDGFAKRGAGNITEFDREPERERRRVGPEVGPTSAFHSRTCTGMRGPACIFWANLTPFSLGGTKWKRGHSTDTLLARASPGRATPSRRAPPAPARPARAPRSRRGGS